MANMVTRVRRYKDFLCEKERSPISKTFCTAILTSEIETHRFLQEFYLKRGYQCGSFPESSKYNTDVGLTDIWETVDADQVPV